MNKMLNLIKVSSYSNCHLTLANYNENNKDDEENEEEPINLYNKSHMSYSYVGRFKNRSFSSFGLNLVSQFGLNLASQFGLSLASQNIINPLIIPSNFYINGYDYDSKSMREKPTVIKYNTRAGLYRLHRRRFNYRKTTYKSDFITKIVIEDFICARKESLVNKKQYLKDKYNKFI